MLTHGEEFVSTVNSYLSMMRRFASYGLRRKVMMRVGKEWWRVAYFEGHIEKAVLKKRYRPVERKKREIRNKIRELKKAIFRESEWRSRIFLFIQKTL